MITARQLFAQIDADGSGGVDMGEFAAALEAMGVPVTASDLLCVRGGAVTDPEAEHAGWE